MLETEGAFAVWEFDEIVSILGEENAKICNAHFGVKPGGNAGRNDPHKELVKKVWMRLNAVLLCSFF